MTWTKVTYALPPEKDCFQRRMYMQENDFVEDAMLNLYDMLPILERDKTNTVLYIQEPVEFPHVYRVDYRGITIAKFDVYLTESGIRTHGLFLYGEAIDKVNKLYGVD